MIFPQAHFEVEFRCQFSNDEEAYQALPFLRESLKREYTWIDAYYGLEIFKSGQVLRAGETISEGKTRYLLGWKGPDTGTFANIRRELDEDITQGIKGSAIMEWLSGEKRAYLRQEVVPEMERMGFRRFMSYRGDNLAGRFEPLGINVKLMHCEILRWPLLVEMEKIAKTEAEAGDYEKELAAICREYRLEKQVVKEEPGTLLYENVDI
jgi:hypothetical protein